MLPSPCKPIPTSPTGGFWRGEAFGIARARVQRSALQGVSVQATGRRGGAVIFGGENLWNPRGRGPRVRHKGGGGLGRRGGGGGRFFWGGVGGGGRASGV